MSPPFGGETWPFGTAAEEAVSDESDDSGISTYHPAEDAIFGLPACGFDGVSISAVTLYVRGMVDDEYCSYQGAYQLSGGDLVYGTPANTLALTTQSLPIPPPEGG